MAERILEQQQPLCAALLELKKDDLMPSEKEFSTLEHFTEFMKPMVEITEAIGGEKWVTISAIRPVLHKLLEIHLQPSPSDSHAVKQMKEVIRKDLKDRYTSETLDI